MKLKPPKKYIRKIEKLMKISKLRKLKNYEKSQELRKIIFFEISFLKILIFWFQYENSKNFRVLKNSWCKTEKHVPKKHIPKTDWVRNRKFENDNLFFFLQNSEKSQNFDKKHQILRFLKFWDFSHFWDFSRFCKIFKIYEFSISYCFITFGWEGVRELLDANNTRK